MTWLQTSLCVCVCVLIEKPYCTNIPVMYVILVVATVGSSVRFQSLVFAMSWSVCYGLRSTLVHVGLSFAPNWWGGGVGGKHKICVNITCRSHDRGLSHMMCHMTQVT